MLFNRRFEPLQQINFFCLANVPPISIEKNRNGKNRKGKNRNGPMYCYLVKSYSPNGEESYAGGLEVCSSPSELRGGSNYPGEPNQSRPILPPRSLLLSPTPPSNLRTSTDYLPILNPPTGKVMGWCSYHPPNKDTEIAKDETSGGTNRLEMEIVSTGGTSEDGRVNPSKLTCRICRENILEGDPGVAVGGVMEEISMNSLAPGAGTGTGTGTGNVDNISINVDNNSNDIGNDKNASGDNNDNNDNSSESLSCGSEQQGQKKQQQRQQLKDLSYLPYLLNPMTSPCSCAGTIGYVHRICVSEWRLRSRHPMAANGKNCETCGTAYVLPPLPPPPTVDNDNNALPEGIAGPMGGGGVQNWLDAMPPHVLRALRSPLPLWSLLSHPLRSRYLRPILPVVLSPLFSLYTRGRRVLKKRGVSRRRWSCSLCGRRARWKCVRCLRSYYCSRECQNVDWHLQHKYLCYKPSRLAVSVLVYFLALLLSFPEHFRPSKEMPLTVSLLVSSPILFSGVGTLFGKTLSVVRKAGGGDWRGRIPEVAVTIATGIILKMLRDVGRVYFISGIGSDAAKGVCWDGGEGEGDSLETVRRARDFVLNSVANDNVAGWGECRWELFFLSLFLLSWFVVISGGILERNMLATNGRNAPRAERRGNDFAENPEERRERRRRREEERLRRRVREAGGNNNNEDLQ